MISLNLISFTGLNLSMSLSTWFQGSRFNINAVKVQNNAVNQLCDVVHCTAWWYLCSPAPYVKYFKQAVCA